LSIDAHLSIDHGELATQLFRKDNHTVPGGNLNIFTEKLIAGQPDILQCYIIFCHNIQHIFNTTNTHYYVTVLQILMFRCSEPH
jgi:hypothetical protein